MLEVFEVDLRNNLSTIQSLYGKHEVHVFVRRCITTYAEFHYSVQCLTFDDLSII